MVEKQRNTYWQAVRGICIIAVVLIHCANGIQYGTQPDATASYNFWIIERCIIDFPVAVFIFLSAYFTNTGMVTQDRSNYLGSRVKKLLIPYLIWSVFYGALRVTIAILTGKDSNVLELLSDICTGRISTPMYFILVLLQLTLLTPLIVRFCENKIFNVFSLLLTPVYFVIIYAFSYFRNIEWIYAGTLFPAWFIFYYLGIKASKRHEFWKTPAFSSRAKYMLVLVALVVSIIEAFGLLNLGVRSSDAVSQTRFSSLIYVFCLLWLMQDQSGLPQKKASRFTRFLAYIGDMSYGIFYIHSFYLTVIAVAMKYLSINISILPLLQAIQLIFSLFASVITIILLRKVLGRKNAGQYLGV